MSHSIIRKLSCFFFILLIILEIISISLNSFKLIQLFHLSDTSKNTFIFDQKIFIIIVITYNLICIFSIWILGFYSIYTKRLKFLYFHIIFSFFAILLIIFYILFFYEKKNLIDLIYFILNIAKGISYILNIIMVILECNDINNQLKKSLLNIVDDNLTDDMIQSILDSSKSLDSESIEREYKRLAFRKKQKQIQRKRSSNSNLEEEDEANSN